MRSNVALGEVHPHVLVQSAGEMNLRAKSVEVVVLRKKVQRHCVKNLAVIAQYVESLTFQVLRDRDFPVRRIWEHSQLDADYIYNRLAIVHNLNLDLTVIETLRLRILPLKRVDAGQPVVVDVNVESRRDEVSENPRHVLRQCPREQSQIPVLKIVTFPQDNHRAAWPVTDHAREQNLIFGASLFEHANKLTKPLHFINVVYCFQQLTIWCFGKNDCLAAD